MFRLKNIYFDEFQIYIHDLLLFLQLITLVFFSIFFWKTNFYLLMELSDMKVYEDRCKMMNE